MIIERNGYLTSQKPFVYSPDYVRRAGTQERDTFREPAQQLELYVCAAP
jgi:hypothetical protein